MRQASPFSPLGETAGAYHTFRFLSNGRTIAWVTGEGTGRTLFGEYALTGWSGDPLRIDGGTLFYVRDLDSGSFRRIGRMDSAGGSRRRASWEPGRVESESERDGIDVRMEIAVPPGSDFEIRRIRVKNRSGRERRIELTAYAEIVLDRPASFAAHPAFSKLFVQTAFDAATGTILAKRRSRSGDESHPRAFAVLSGPGAIEFETDRSLFLGRGRSIDNPLAMKKKGPLSGTAGNVLDPVFALRRRAVLPPEGEILSIFLLGAAEDEERAVALARKWTVETEAERALASAREEADARIEEAGLSVERAEYLQALAGAMLHGGPGIGVPASAIEKARGRPSDIARFGLDPRRPTIVLHAETPEGARLLPELLAARRYWMANGLDFPALVLHGGARPEVPDDGSGGFLFLEREKLSAETVDLLDGAARLVLAGGWPDLHDRAGGEKPRSSQTGDADVYISTERDGGAVRRKERDLLLFNGLGGFTPDGSEYVIHLSPDENGRLNLPPLPWINVIANERVGFLVSERGAGCTWSGNSREHRLTPWANDPLRDPFGEAFYLRDEENGALFSPLPGPIEGGGECEVRHGFGYTIFRREAGGLALETTLFVPPAIR